MRSLLPLMMSLAIGCQADRLNTASSNLLTLSRSSALASCRTLLSSDAGLVLPGVGLLISDVGSSTVECSGLTSSTSATGLVLVMPPSLGLGFELPMAPNCFGSLGLELPMAPSCLLSLGFE